MLSKHLIRAVMLLRQLNYKRNSRKTILLEKIELRRK